MTGNGSVTRYVWEEMPRERVTDLLDRRLRRAGLEVVPLTGAGRELAERLIPLDHRDVALAMALHAMPPGYVALMREAAARGAHGCGARSGSSS